MRMPFRHERTFSVARTTFDVLRWRVDLMTYPASIIDVYLRAYQGAGGSTDWYIYAFKTLAQALAFVHPTTIPMPDADKTAAGVIAYLEHFTRPAGITTETLTNHVPLPPDMTGFAVDILSQAASGTAWDSAWGYTAAPSAAAMDEILYLFNQRIGAGQILDGFSAVQMVIAPDGVFKAMAKGPNIVAALVEDVDSVREAGKFAREAHFTIVVGDIIFTTTGQVDYSNLLRTAGAIASYLGDEYRTLNGITIETVISRVGGPLLVEGDEQLYLGARIDGTIQYRRLESDRR